MDIEPHHITTVSRRPPVGMDKPRTLADYQADLVRRFGSLPSWAELAKMENAARWQRNPVSTMARPQVPQPIHPNSKAAVEAILAKGEATRTSILAVLTQPMTCPDVATALKRSPQLIRRHLGILAEQGKVMGRDVKRVTVWERIQEAAE
jgi:hypothetical protein